MLVWLASYPRSGNNLFRLILWHELGLPSYSIYADDVAPLAELHRALGTTSLDDLHFRPELYLVKRHDPPASDHHPAVHLVRDGRDAIVSFAHYLADDGAVADLDANLRMLVEQRGPFGGWAAHSRAWLERRPRPVRVRFETLIRRGRETAVEALRALGIPPAGGSLRVLAPSLVLGWAEHPSDTVPSFHALRERNPRLYRRGVCGAFRDEMPPAHEASFWSHAGPVMERLGYERRPQVQESCR